MFFKRKKPLYSIGDKVRISNPDKILKTLDQDRKLYGLLFMDQMWQYCNNEVTITKIVKRFEYKTILLAKMPIYLLNGIRCNGKSELLENKCDLNCHLMWHEDWLESYSR
jgi:hypothetical protein